MRYGTMTLDEVVADLEQAIRARNNGEMPDLAAQAASSGHA